MKFVAGKKSVELITTGKDFFPGFQVPLWHNPQESFAPDLGAGTRFRLALVEEGTGILRLGERRLAFIAPTLFCFNEIERPEVEQNLDLRAQALYFHPNIINSDFTFENIRSNLHPLSLSASQDRNWLQPFLQRGSEGYTPISVGPTAARQLARLIVTVGHELAAQRDESWPCRSRSYFLELLFLVERISTDPEKNEAVFLAESPAGQEVAAILLYLNTHYPDKITIAQLTRTFHTNRTTLAKQFRETTGLPVMTYLIRLRMQLAALMLRNTELSIVEIMQRVGFSDHAYFTRAFQKHTQHTPSQYRQQNCWMLHN
jgi:AraC family L-rhamnose operon regulatory protein RhaS